jgi:hypothetical protein
VLSGVQSSVQGLVGRMACRAVCRVVCRPHPVGPAVGRGAYNTGYVMRRDYKWGAPQFWTCLKRR